MITQNNSECGDEFYDYFVTDSNSFCKLWYFFPDFMFSTVNIFLVSLISTLIGVESRNRWNHHHCSNHCVPCCLHQKVNLWTFLGTKMNYVWLIVSSLRKQRQVLWGTGCCSLVHPGPLRPQPTKITLNC